MKRVVLTGRTPLLAGQPTGWPLKDLILFDLSSLSFATPFELAGLGVLALAAPVRIEIGIRPPTDPGVCNYLQRMDLFAVLGSRVTVKPSLPEELPRDRTRPLIELRRLRHADEIDDSAGELWPRLRARFSVETCRNLFDVLGELVDNAATHGDSATGALVAAQYYSGATSKMPEGIWVGVADGGIGILRHLQGNRRYRHLRRDSEAIRLAVRPWVTGTVDRRGWGLVQVLEAAGRFAPGIVVIRSGRGEGRFWVGPTGTRTARYREYSFAVPGTWVLVLAGHATSS